MLRTVVAGLSHAIASAGVGRFQSAPPAADRWKLEWDDRVDGVIQEGPKTCEVLLHFGEAKVGGEFAGTVEGRTRSANFVGDARFSK